MNRRVLLAIAALAIVLTTVAVIARNAAQPAVGTMVVAGDARAQLYTVRAPAVSAPRYDITVGIPAASLITSPSKTQGPGSGASPAQPAVSGTLAEVRVTEGQRVKAGQVVALLDQTMLNLAVSQARANAARAHATVGVMGANLDTLADARSQLTTARSQLTTARGKVTDALAQLATGRAQLVAQIAQVEALLPHAPSMPTTASPVPPKPVLMALLAKLRGLLAQLDAGKAKAEAGLAQIDTGASKLADAKQKLTDARDLLELVAAVQDTGVTVAQARRDAATLRAPVDGVVTYSLRVGAVVMVGAPVVQVRPDGPSLVDTYLTGEQLASVSVGTSATVTYDSNAGAPLRGAVTHIGTVAEFPPASFPTDIVHMTRTVKVTITLEPGRTAPPGTPVDITIRTGP